MYETHISLSVCRYWRYNEETRTTDRDFPKPINRWGRIPSSPKGVFLSDDGGTYRLSIKRMRPSFGVKRPLLFI